jgi:hypothetical protein
MQTIDTLNIVLLIVFAAMGIFALLLTMGYMVYGGEEED